jgi:chemotaxis protein histidine kinase CheA
MLTWLSSLWARLRRPFRDGADEMVDPAWREQRKHAATLQEIRRGFHTLKGSARVVGANDLGAFCGRIEKLTLDMIERPNAVAADSVASIEQAIGLLPECGRALRAGHAVPAAVHGVARAVQGD